MAETPSTGDSGVLICPSCNGQDWIQVKAQASVPECKNCKYSPALSSPGSSNFEEWFKTIKEEWEQLQETSLPEGDGIIALAARRRRDRSLERSQRRWKIAQALKTLLEADIQEGAVTIHVPDLGLLEQFKIGDYNLFKGLVKG